MLVVHVCVGFDGPLGLQPDVDRLAIEAVAQAPEGHVEDFRAEELFRGDVRVDYVCLGGVWVVQIIGKVVVSALSELDVEVFSVLGTTWNLVVDGEFELGVYEVLLGLILKIGKTGQTYGEEEVVILLSLLDLNVFFEVIVEGEHVYLFQLRLFNCLPKDVGAKDDNDEIEQKSAARAASGSVNFITLNVPLIFRAEDV